ncbi:MAG: YeeE/YedE family protein [Treponema sp.]|jgi:uncharacterized membrane protein YedE/YeeE|nr:YeeE/YedE family protein [Treponema sp.]
MGYYHRKDLNKEGYKTMENEKKVSYYDTLLKKEWSYTTGAVIMSALAVMLAAFAGPWGVSGVLAVWAGKFFSLFGVNADSWKIFNGSLARFKLISNQTALTDIGLSFGALISCLLAAQWKIRMIKSIRQVWAAVFGGLLMGIGARISPGCNIGAMFSSIPAFSLSGWIFLIFVFLGAVIGGKTLTTWFLPPVSHERRKGRKQLSPEQRRRNRNIQIVIGILLILCWLVFAAAVKEKAPSAGIFLFIGLGIGYTLQHSRFCFTAAYRDPTLTGSTKMAKALLVGLAISTIGFAGIHIARYGVDLSKFPEAGLGSPIGIHLVVGAFIFGIGAVWAGGCASGTFVRVGEGYVQSMIALVFFILGALIGTQVLTAVIQPNAFLYPNIKIYLPKLFGGFGPAVMLQLLVLLGLWILADWWERKKIADFGK